MKDLGKAFVDLTKIEPIVVQPFCEIIKQKKIDKKDKTNPQVQWGKRSNSL